MAERAVTPVCPAWNPCLLLSSPITAPPPPPLSRPGKNLGPGPRTSRKKHILPSRHALLLGRGGRRKVRVLEGALGGDTLGGVVDEGLREQVESVGVEARHGGAEVGLVPLRECALVVGQRADAGPGLLVGCSEQAVV